MFWIKGKYCIQENALAIERKMLSTENNDDDVSRVQCQEE